MSFSDKVIEKVREIQKKRSQIIRVGTSMLNPCRAFMDVQYHINNWFPQFKIEIAPFGDDHNGILSFIDKIGNQFDFIVGV